MKNLRPQALFGIFLIGLSVYSLAHLAITESFIGTLFPTGITAILIGVLGFKLLGFRRKTEKESKETPLLFRAELGDQEAKAHLMKIYRTKTSKSNILFLILASLLLTSIFTPLNSLILWVVAIFAIMHRYNINSQFERIKGIKERELKPL